MHISYYGIPIATMHTLDLNLFNGFFFKTLIFTQNLTNYKYLFKNIKEYEAAKLLKTSRFPP